MTPSCLLGLAILHLLFELRAEWLQIRFQKPDIATHHAEVGYLLTLTPKIHRLGAYAKEAGRFLDGHGQFGVSSELGVIGHVVRFKAPALNLLVEQCWRYGHCVRRNRSEEHTSEL